MSTASPHRLMDVSTDPDDSFSLPGWVYHDADYFQIEMARVMRPSWQVVCHISDVPNIGDYHTLDFLRKNILVIRGDDRRLRAFANVCRHRASRLLDGTSGCARKIVCPYHAWTYELDGRLSGIPERSQYGALDMDKYGLVPVELEIFHGFIFVRLKSGGPSVAAMMAPYADEIAPYRFEDLRAIGRVTMRTRTVNWKNIADNYSDGLHINVAHPGLKRLFGRGYGIEAQSHVDKMWGALAETRSSNPSELMYQHLLPAVPHLPPERQKLWTYFKLWPNVAFDIYPDQVDFMQFLPISPTETLIREIAYAIPDDRREMKLARYLNWRINRQVNAEDTTLVARVQQGMYAQSYTPGPLGNSEVCLKSFARKLRTLIPETRLHQPPSGYMS